jgi:hypothetical protein
MRPKQLVDKHFIENSKKVLISLRESLGFSPARIFDGFDDFLMIFDGFLMIFDDFCSLSLIFDKKVPISLRELLGFSPARTNITPTKNHQKPSKICKNQ